MDDSVYILQRIDKYFNKIASDAHNTFIEGIGCDYYPTPIEFITNALTFIKEREPNFSGKTFLDVGCGIGNICGVAAHMGLNAEGIELNPVLYNIGKEIYPEIRFHNVDIRDFNEYNKYDIIFYFAPMGTENLERDLKIKVENNIHIGAYVIISGWRFEKTKDDRFIKLYTDNDGFRDIWQKIK